MLALFATLLLYAGQPLQPSAPPVPLQRPPPGHVPDGVQSSVTYVAPGTFGNNGALLLANDFFGMRSRLLCCGRIRLTGRGAFLDFWYRPQALQMVAPVGDLLQSGVSLVPQFLQYQVRIHAVRGATDGRETYWHTWPAAGFTTSLAASGLRLGIGLGLVAALELCGLDDLAASWTMRSSSDCTDSVRAREAESLSVLVETGRVGRAVLSGAEDSF